MSSIATLVPNLRAAFRERLLTLIGLPTARAWEAETFSPSDGAAYVAESFQVLSSIKRSVGNPDGTGGTIEHRLLGAATFFFPMNQGTNAIESLAGAAQLLFLPGVRLSRSGDSAVVQNVSRSSLYRDGERIACAVSINLLAFTQS